MLNNSVRQVFIKLKNKKVITKKCEEEFIAGVTHIKGVSAVYLSFIHCSMVLLM